MSEPSKMSENQDIICVECCEQKIFAVGSCPDECPECKINLKECDLKIPPFSVPTPFSRAQDHPCSIVIKPTKGDFLHDYQNRNNLHIGLTNSKGFVVEYDSQGLHRDRTLDWNQCIVIGLNNAIDPDVICDPDWPEYWDACLEAASVLSPSQWTVEAYEAQEHNCFAFVLAFLRSLKQNPLSMHANNKVDFCTHYVLPKTILAGKYICLFRKIKARDTGVYVTSKKYNRK